MVVTQEGLQRLAVGLGQPVGPEILAHHGERVFDMGVEPGQHALERGGLLQALVAEPLRLAERLEQVHRDPAVLLVDLAADGDDMHDREDAGLAPVVLLDRDVVGEQAPDLHPVEGRGLAGGVQRVDLALGEHPRQGLAGRDALDLDAVGQVELDLLVAVGLFFAAGDVGDAVGGDVVMILENAADPDRRRHLVLGRADALADQVARRLDTGIGVHVDAGVPEEAAGKHRDGDEGPLGAGQRDGV